MNLFVIYIGGMHEKSLIELHDMRFIIAEKIEDTYEPLKKSWWGIPESLHLDAWGVLKYADGHTIKIENKPQKNAKNKLYFINLGGYDKNKFTELHKNIFIVADNESNAKSKALKQIEQWESPHRDYQYEIEHILDITNISTSNNIFIHLHPTDNIQELEFICRYIPIDKKPIDLDSRENSKSHLISHITSTKTASHYLWGNNYDGWWLKKNGRFTVIFEMLPPDGSEVKHFHSKTEQFFYILEGTLSIELNGENYHLEQHDGITVIPDVIHKVFNQSNQNVRFLVISCPDSHGDRVNLEEQKI